MPSELHDQLVVRAVKWLRGTKRCTVVAAELMTTAPIVPDAIGWNSWTSHLVEVKVSRADFHRDKFKPSHRSGHIPCDYRWYMTPPRLLKPDDIPDGWGLLEVRPKTVRVVVDAPRVCGHTRTERALMFSICRRLQIGLKLNVKTGRFDG